MPLGNCSTTVPPSRKTIPMRLYYHSEALSRITKKDRSLGPGYINSATLLSLIHSSCRGQLQVLTTAHASVHLGRHRDDYSAECLVRAYLLDSPQRVGVHKLVIHLD